MKSFVGVAMAGALCFCGASPAFDVSMQAAPVKPMAAKPGSSTSFDFVSKFNDEAYHVEVYVPKDEAADHGHPVLYLLDGNVLFGTFAAAEKNRSQAGEIESAVIVGIESGTGTKEADRTYDFTYSDLSPREKEIVVDLGSNPRFGGYDKFFQVIENEIKPKVAQLTAVDNDRAVLFGWSLGGLFVIHTMLEHPTSFSAYAALSPSLWRDNRSAFRDIPAFEKRVSETDQHSRLFVGVGGLEEELSPALLSWPVDHKKFALEMKYARMVGNAKDFAEDVQPFFAKKHLDFMFKIFEGDTHNSVPWSAVNPVLSFMFPVSLGQRTDSSAQEAAHR